MKKQSKTVKEEFFAKGKAPLILLVGLMFCASFLAAPLVGADKYDEKIRALQTENNKVQSSLNNLESEASSYQDAISRLRAQISAVRQQIAANRAKQSKLQNEIAAKQAEIDKQRKVLGADLKAMYVDDQMSTIEMLATSKNLSDYVDKEEYRSAVQSKIQETLKEIAKLQQQLQRQKSEIEALLEDQQSQEAQLAKDEAKQNELLTYNESQQNSFNSKLKANSGRIAELRRQQAIENARYSISSLSGDPNHGGYPRAWDSAPQDSLVDYWGMYNRECVSYTAFKVHQDYLSGRNKRDMPYWGGVGNANQWDDNARAADIPVDTHPTRGSIAISNAGYYGHAMYVESSGTINGQAAVYVSQYNAGLNGRYSEGWRYTTGLVFLHF